jgi:anti-anti-sigma regulatory factor
MLGHDTNTHGVRVVVIDLSDAILDEGFGAAGLEQALETIGGWGAEAILAGVSAINEAVIDGLDPQHMVTRKDLPDAIAMAFQITEAQRHAL